MGEAIERMLVEKKISSKINYDVLRDLDKSWQGGVAKDSNNDNVVDESDRLETGLTNSLVIVQSSNVNTGSVLSLTRKRSNSMATSSIQSPPSK